MKKLVIDRSRWLRGEGATESRLQRKRDGKRCCVGMYCIQILEIPEEEIIGVGALEQAADPSPWMLAHTGWKVSSGPIPLVNALYSLNDIIGIDDETRELWIAAAFATGDIEVEFVDGPVSP